MNTATEEAGLILCDHSYSTAQYKPLYLRRIENSLGLDCLIRAAEASVTTLESSDDDLDSDAKEFLKHYKPNKVQAKRERGRPSNATISTEAHEKKLIRQSLYCTSHLKYKKKWLRDLLLSESDTSDESDDNEPDYPISEDRFRQMLAEHVQLKKYRDIFPSLTNTSEFKDYTKGILVYEPFPVPMSDKPLHRLKKKSLGAGSHASGSCKASSVTSSFKPSTPASTGVKLKQEKLEDGEVLMPFGSDVDQIFSGLDSPTNTPQSSSKAAGSTTGKSVGKGKKVVTAEMLLSRRKKLWHAIVKKDIAKAAKARTNLKKEQISNARKCAVAIMKQKRKEALASQKASANLQTRMKRICRDIAVYWKRFEKVEKQQLKKVQKEAQEQRKQDLNMLEAKRQARKLNFLITQTELYAHFMAKKITGATDQERNQILNRLDEHGQLQLSSMVQDDYDVDEAKEQVLSNVEDAYAKQTSKTQKFDASIASLAQSNMGLSNPVQTGNEYPQPSIFVGKLKSYQIKGMNWLANLYSQGINGILADEMGLGKTVQSIAFLAHLAEVHGIWGPFLVIAPASTLHNWQQECSRFLPKMRVVPYWGTTQERKILRKFWDQQNLHTENASFHIVITSYQLVIQDCKYFSKINWHYMVLDEAQALKSSTSARWRTLLSFQCRNRLLLTGTPIQNSMAELWALLHFIMPTLFDSHDEFNEWFSKDIENHVENKSNIDQNHLSRLHMILKPFMLRRIKKDVENDLTDKIEVLVYCPLTIRQRYLYDAIKRKIRIEDLLAGVTQASSSASNTTTSSLMNLVMQFRKVCNHPELFERRDIKSPAFVCAEPCLIPKLVYREGLLSKTVEASKSHILYNLLNIHQPAYTHLRSLESDVKCGDNLFSWMRLINLSSSDLYKIMLTGLMSIIIKVYERMAERRKLQHFKMWSLGLEDQVTAATAGYLSRRMLMLEDGLPTDWTHRSGSCVLSSLVFTDYTSHSSAHVTHNIYYMKETQAHRKIRLKGQPDELDKQPASPVKKRHKGANVKAQPLPIETTTSSTRELGHYDTEESQKLYMTLELQLTPFPIFLSHMIPKALSSPIPWYCYDRSAQNDIVRSEYCGSLEARDLVRLGPDPQATTSWSHQSAGGIQAISPPYGFSNVYIPDKRSMIVDAGKMHVLDELLTKLKREGHRVLIYSTMTKVIDLLEEFMWYRKHQYMRLDGSSKISDRRDMVSDFQSKTDIFVFLLSTRAGGLGINLTAADTVIFYDSDWNPTVDAQAMDRAHRLGQTKQVTVYRLICKGTIEERILERAKEKSEIQRMVISGHNNFKPDVLKPKEMVSLLIDDESLKQRIEQAQESKGETKAEKRKINSNSSAAASKKAKTEDNGAPKKKRGRKPGAKAAAAATEGGDPSSASTPRSTPQPAGNGMAAHLSNGVESNASFTLGPEEESLDVDIFDDECSRTSSPAVSSAPSTPSVQSSTPGGRKSRGRPKGSSNLTSSSATKLSRAKSSSASLKKALTAAEIAGAKAGMSAAYAAYGINKPAATANTPTPGAASKPSNK